jgi:quercetin dioxygenase-like cupin family protein
MQTILRAHRTQDFTCRTIGPGGLMSKIVLRSVEDVPFVSVAGALESGTIADGGGTSTESIATQDIRVLFEGNDDEMQVVEVRCTAEKPTVPHAHRGDEVVYILEGELIVGKRTMGPGSAIFVPANTMYAFKVGPNGVRYLNMRPTRDDSYIPKDEFMAERTGP